MIRKRSKDDSILCLLSNVISQNKIILMSKVYIRPVDSADMYELIEMNQRSQSYHYPWVAPFIDKSDFDTWFSRCQKGTVVGLVVCKPDSNEIVGLININEIVAGSFQSGYLGYYGSVDHAGQGYMTEALRLAIRYAFEKLNLHRLEANIQPENTRSIALVRRVGFPKEGFSPKYLFVDGKWRDHERWAVLNE